MTVKNDYSLRAKQMYISHSFSSISIATNNDRTTVHKLATSLPPVDYHIGLTFANSPDLNANENKLEEIFSGKRIAT